ncbi:platelet glycoprotein Ib beta chain isoform X1 [Paramormyrops kingsleyae]|uniref:platelet glycoprotein Ib beta chain isoform X1 n=1 Tax=Paramormyrops kingsleyae TaxID=1676925 RepID=UPI003B97C1A6
MLNNFLERFTDPPSKLSRGALSTEGSCRSPIRNLSTSLSVLQLANTRGYVDCSGRMLRGSNLPNAFPPDSREIHLHDNQLTSLPNGLLDHMLALHSVSLYGNPWVCDCGVLYLRSWLLRQENRKNYRNITCSSPPGLQGRLVMYLAEEEVLESCRYWYCSLALASQVSLFIFIVLQAILLASIIFFLRRFEKLSREARRTVQESFAGDDGGNGEEYVPLKGLPETGSKRGTR